MPGSAGRLRTYLVSPDGEHKVWEDKALMEAEYRSLCDGRQAAVGGMGAESRAELPWRR